MKVRRDDMQCIFSLATRTEMMKEPRVIMMRSRLAFFPMNTFKMVAIRTTAPMMQEMTIRPMQAKEVCLKAHGQGLMVPSQSSVHVLSPARLTKQLPLSRVFIVWNPRRNVALQLRSGTGMLILYHGVAVATRRKMEATTMKMVVQRRVVQPMVFAAF